MEFLSVLLGRYVFRPVDERQLQDQLASVIESHGWKVQREVRVEGGRYDLLVDLLGKDGVMRTVLELKLAAPASAVERQAQRYALEQDVDAVVVITTSARLARDLVHAGDTIGGKPFGVIALRAL